MKIAYSLLLFLSLGLNATKKPTLILKDGAYRGNEGNSPQANLLHSFMRLDPQLAVQALEAGANMHGFYANNAKNAPEELSPLYLLYCGAEYATLTGGMDSVTASNKMLSFLEVLLQHGVNIKAGVMSKSSNTTMKDIIAALKEARGCTIESIKPMIHDDRDAAQLKVYALRIYTLFKKYQPKFIEELQAEAQPKSIASVWLKFCEQHAANQNDTCTDKER